jgi:deoxycytidylate deaminase
MRKSKRREPLNRDDYWMAMVFMLAAGSTSIKQQGCIVVNSNYELLGMGHDGHPKTMQECEHTIHAEMNALFNCELPIHSGMAYLTHTPCYHCAMSLVAANIKRIVYFHTKPIDSETEDAIKCSYGQLEQFKGNLNWMRDYIKTLDIFE